MEVHVQQILTKGFDCTCGFGTEMEIGRKIMKKIVNVEIPALDENYDILVPEFLRVQEVINLIAETVVSLSNGRYCLSRQEVLCLKERNILLVQNATLGNYGIKNGEHLVLI